MGGVSDGSTRRGLLGRLAGLAGLGPFRRRRGDALGRRELAGGISLGRSPSLREIETLARKRNVRSLLNLNTEGESGEQLSPNVEASWAHAYALHHERLSIDVGVLRSEWVEAFGETLRRIPKPVYVHSRLGRRAAALMAIHEALAGGMAGGAALERARALGLEGPADALEDFVVAQVDLRAPAPAAAFGTARS